MEDSLTLRCDCFEETISIDLYLEMEDDDSFLSISPMWNAGRYWRERWRAAWAILRGKESYFAGVVLKRSDVTSLADFLAPYQT